MSPSCSVIIPVYNAGKRLSPCIESVLAQRETSWELILVDDGSGDGSGNVCDEYAVRDARIRVIHTPNAGPGAARNTGMDAARAPWITFVDADDIILPDYLETLLGAEPSPGSLCITGIQKFPIGGQPSILYNFSQREEADDVSSLEGKYRLLICGFPVAKLFDASLLREHRLRMDTAIRYHEDHVFFLRYLQICRKIILLPGVPYRYTLDPAVPTLSSSLVKKQKQTSQALLEARMLTDEMLTVYKRFPATPLRAFRRAVSTFGMSDYVRVLRNASSREDYLLAAREIYARKEDFRRFYRPQRGFLHKWLDLLRAFRAARSF